MDRSFECTSLILAASDPWAGAASALLWSFTLLVGLGLELTPSSCKLVTPWRKSKEDGFMMRLGFELL